MTPRKDRSWGLLVLICGATEWAALCRWSRLGWAALSAQNGFYLGQLLEAQANYSGDIYMMGNAIADHLWNDAPHFNNEGGYGQKVAFANSELNLRKDCP